MLEDLPKSLEEIQQLVYTEYCKNGFKEKFEQHKEIGDIAELGLIVTEISEVIECIRQDDAITNIGFELADIIIRVMNFANRKGIDLESFIIEKNKINQNRGKYHENQNI